MVIKFFFKDFAAGYANQLCSYPQHSKLGQKLNINNLLINSKYSVFIIIIIANYYNLNCCTY